MPKSSQDIPVHSTENSTPITLTIGSLVIPAVLYNRETSKDLISKLPHKVRISKYHFDFCGNIGLKLNYAAKEVQNGFHNGELAYWVPGGDFVIFYDNEENSIEEATDCIMLGKLAKDSDLEKVKKLTGNIEVMIQLAK